MSGRGQKNSSPGRILPPSIRGTTPAESDNSPMTRTFTSSLSVSRRTFSSSKRSSMAAAASSSSSAAANASSPLSQSASLRQIARAAVSEFDQQQQAEQSTNRNKATRAASGLGRKQRKSLDSQQQPAPPPPPAPPPMLANLHALRALCRQQDPQQQSGSARKRDSFAELSSSFNSAADSSTSVSFSIAAQLEARIQNDLAEIKRKIPIASISQFTLTNVPSTPKSLADSFVVTAEDQNSELASPICSPAATAASGGGGGGVSAQLATERDLHRQRLDEVWRCAQGWKARCRATEDALKRLAGSMLSAELARFSEVEERYRLEILAAEQSEWQKGISSAFVQMLKRVLTQWAGHQCGVNGVPTNPLTPPQLQQNQQCNQQINVTRVKDSDLLRALRAAESKLAQLGESSSAGRSGSFHYA